MEAKTDFKAMPFKKKVGYIWDYYRFPIFLVFFIAIFLISWIQFAMKEKESVLDLLFLNGEPAQENATGLDEFFTLQGFDKEKQEITVLTHLRLVLSEDSYDKSDYNTVRSIAAKFTLGDLDIFAAPQQIYNEYAASGYIADLRTVLSEEELKAYEDLLVYATNIDTNETFPCALDLSDNHWIQEFGYYENDCCFGFTSNGDGIELAKEFLFYILNY